MKTKLNILCFLLLIAFAGCMYNAFLGGMEGASDASRGDIGNKLQPLFYVNVVPTEGNELNDSIPSVIEKGNFTPTYILLAAAIIILVGMYFYLNKHLPQPGTPSEITNTQA